MPFLMDLPCEVLEEIVLKLEDVEDVISLGSSSIHLTRIVDQNRLWRVLMAKIELVDDDRVRIDQIRKITSFVSSLSNSEAIFSLLNQRVCEIYHATGQGWEDDIINMDEESIDVSLPGDLQHHSVSVLGLEVLALIGREAANWEAAGLKVHNVNVFEISPSHLLSLASLQRDQIPEMSILWILCTSEDEGAALFSLLERCSAWSLGRLCLGGWAGGQTWQRLGREAARGRLRGVETGREEVRRGRREDLRAVWGRTEVGWWVDEEVILKNGGEEEGWKKIEEMIK